MSQQTDSQKTVNNFIVVEFINRGRKPSRKCVDIVPKLWIKRDKKIWKCLYPPAPYENVQSMIQNFQCPQEKTWTLNTIKILGDAGKCIDNNFFINKKKKNNKIINHYFILFLFLIN